MFHGKSRTKPQEKDQTKWRYAIHLAMSSVMEIQMRPQPENRENELWENLTETENSTELSGVDEATRADEGIGGSRWQFGAGTGTGPWRPALSTRLGPLLTPALRPCRVKPATATRGKESRDVDFYSPNYYRY